MEGLISFLITIAFYSLLFRAIKKLAGRGKPAAAKKRQAAPAPSAPHQAAAARQEEMPALMNFLRNQAGLGTLMDNIAEAQRLQKEKLEEGQREREEKARHRRELKGQRRAAQQHQRHETAAAQVRPKPPEAEVNPNPLARISGKDLKKAVVYSEIIAPPLALR